MERHVLLTCCMPCENADVTIGLPPLRAVHEAFSREGSPAMRERNLQSLQGVYRMESAFPRYIRISAHFSRRLLTLRIWHNPGEVSL